MNTTIVSVFSLVLFLLFFSKLVHFQMVTTENMANMTKKIARKDGRKTPQRQNTWSCFSFKPFGQNSVLRMNLFSV